MQGAAAGIKHAQYDKGDMQDAGIETPHIQSVVILAQATSWLKAFVAAPGPSWGAVPWHRAGKKWRTTTTSSTRR